MSDEPETLDPAYGEVLDLLGCYFTTTESRKGPEFVAAVVQLVQRDRKRVAKGEPKRFGSPGHGAKTFAPHPFVPPTPEEVMSTAVHVEAGEEQYMRGRNQALAHLAQHIAGEMIAGGNDGGGKMVARVAEYEQAKLAIRSLCDDLEIDPGPWDLHLVDVVEKRLRRGIEERDDPRFEELRVTVFDFEAVYDGVELKARAGGGAWVTVTGRQKDFVKGEPKRFGSPDLGELPREITDIVHGTYPGLEYVKDVLDKFTELLKRQDVYGVDELSRIIGWRDEAKR